MRAIILRDYDVSDIGVHRYITDALGVEPTLEITNTDGPESFEAKIRSLDGPGDLFLGLVYQWCVEFKREWLPSVDRLALYMHRDNQFVNTDCFTIQPVKDKGGPALVHAPFTVRPYFRDQVEGIQRMDDPDLDAIWLGSETYTMVGTDYTRQDYLDRIQAAVAGRYYFHRQQKIHSMREYGIQMARAKVAVHIHGLAEHCFRFWESLHLGCCLVAQRFDREVLWADPKGLVPTFDTPEECADLIDGLLKSGAWRDLRDRQREWFLDNHSEARLAAWGVQAAQEGFR